MSNEYTDVIINHDKLTRECYRFWFYVGTLWLDTYTYQTRETTRHGWKTQKFYTRLDHRFSLSQIENPEDVPLSDEIKQQAIKKFTETLTVQTWKDRR